MNPDRHLSSHYDYFLDLVRGDDDSADSHREFYDEYNAVLDMPAEYYLDTIKTVFQDFALVNGTWESTASWCARRTSRDRAADHRRRARRHLRRRPDQGRARAVHRHPEGAPVPLRRGRRRPLRHLLGPPLARAGLPAVRDFIARHQDGAPAKKPPANGAAARDASAAAAQGAGDNRR
jgi:poly(3-hydroxybutyrate) depolymerase